MLVLEENADSAQVSSKQKCDKCNKIILKSSIPLHMKRIHEKNQREKCKFCKKIFRNIYTLKDHMNNYHKNGIHGSYWQFYF